jgi:hypothetical protein
VGQRRRTGNACITQFPNSMRAPQPQRCVYSRACSPAEQFMLRGTSHEYI